MAERPLLFRGFAAVAVILVACGNPTAPGIEGRWAARGIELTSRATEVLLRLPCEQIRATPGLVPDRFGYVRFTTPVRTLSASYELDFTGQLRRDTLAATASILAPGGSPHVTTYLMLSGGDPAFDGYVCGQ